MLFWSTRAVVIGGTPRLLCFPWLYWTELLNFRAPLVQALPHLFSLAQDLR
jgi:hypothetical protein